MKRPLLKKVDIFEQAPSGFIGSKFDLRLEYDNGRRHMVTLKGGMNNDEVKRALIALLRGIDRDKELEEKDDDGT